MSDFLTRRNGTWHFVRRVPAEFASFDARGIVFHSTTIRVAEDRNGRRASRIAEKGLRLRGETKTARVPFDASCIQHTLFAPGALGGLNEEARYVLYVMADTGLRPSEVVNLTPTTICLDAPIPHVKILPEGRRLKTEDSEREIPLVGVALAAMQAHPAGFPRYRDKSSGLSATLNKYLSENRLRPTKDHTIYSLRHSFKDRLIGTEAPDSLIDSLMGTGVTSRSMERARRWNSSGGWSCQGHRPRTPTARRPAPPHCNDSVSSASAVLLRG